MLTRRTPGADDTADHGRRAAAEPHTETGNHDA
jgi:hypothetical protein